VLVRNSRFPIVANRFDGALLHGGEAGGFFGRILGLSDHVAVPLGIFAEEVGRGCLSAEVAVDAGGIDVIAAGTIFDNLL